MKWSIRRSTAGAISSTGIYSAPSEIAGAQKVAITATSAFHPAVSGSTNIYISGRPFVLLLAKPTLALVPGKPSLTGLIVLATDRFWHPIALSITGVPISIKTTLSPQTLTGNNRAELTFSIENPTLPGDYKITVLAQDTVCSALTDSKSITLHVAP